jgi:hypothetical protein
VKEQHIQIQVDTGISKRLFMEKAKSGTIGAQYIEVIILAKSVMVNYIEEQIHLLNMGGGQNVQYVSQCFTGQRTVLIKVLLNL